MGLVVLLFPRGAAARTAVAGDGDQALFVVAVAVLPHVLLLIPTLLQLGMAGGAPPIALNACTGSFFEFAFAGLPCFWGGVFSHSAPIVAAADLSPILSQQAETIILTIIDFRKSLNYINLRKAFKRLHHLLLVMLICVHCYVAYPLSLRHIEAMRYMIRKAQIDCPDGKTMSSANQFFSLAA